MVGEGPVRPFDPHTRTGLEPSDGGAVVAHGLDRHPHHGRAGQGGERIGVGLPPQARGDKAPLEELAPAHPQAVQAPAPADDRVDAGRFLPHPLDAQLVAQVAGHGQGHPINDHHPGSSHPRRRPYGPGQGVADEAGAGGDLVGKGQGQGDVGVEVDHPPGLVLEAPAGDAHRGDGHHHQQGEGHRRGQDVGVGGQEHPQLAQRPGPRALGVAQRNEHHVGGDEAERPGGYAPVPAHQAVLAHGPLERRHPDGAEAKPRQRQGHVSGPATRGAARTVARPGGRRLARLARLGIARPPSWERYVFAFEPARLNDCHLAPSGRLSLVQRSVNGGHKK